MKKKVEDSRATQSLGMIYRHMTEHRHLLSGMMLQWINDLADAVASRHAGLPVSIAAVDTLEFEAQASMDDMLVMEGEITYVGRTSMEVRVDSWAEKIDGSKRRLNRAYMVMVAMDENDQPQPVPGLILETEAQRQEWENGKKRAEIRRARRAEQL